jgi:hypothetical protein
VIGEKYGKDADYAADGVFEGVGNATKIARGINRTSLQTL